MNSFVNYFVEANIGLIFFYIIYWLFLRNENQFSLKRIYLIGSLMVSLLFPLFTLETTTPIVPTISQVVPANWLPEVIVHGNVSISAVDENPISFGWIWISYLYITIALALFILFLIRVGSLISLFRQSRHYTWKTYTIAESARIKGIFSFFHFIFLSSTLRLSNTEKEDILRHEEVHIKRLHSLDTILMHLTGVVFWFNPVIRLYKKALLKLHEFEADLYAVKGHDVDHYCQLLAKVTLQSNGYQLANHFTSSSTLTRITMMKTIRTKIRNWKLVVLIAILPFFFLGVACQDQIARRLDNSTISQFAEFPLEAQADITRWEKKFPGSKFNYTEGAIDDVRDKLSKYPGKQAIINTYPFPDREVTGVLTSDISKFNIQDENGVFRIVEEAAHPKEGIQEFYNQISEKLKYPVKAIEDGVEGKVFVEFIVDKDGTILEPQVLRGADESLNKEAVRVIGLSQSWSPAKQHGKTVKQRIVLPITFLLNSETKSPEARVSAPTDTETMKVTGDLVEEKGTYYMVGKVTDAEGKPLQVNVELMGTQRGTVSHHLTGNYKLQVDNPTGRLRFFFNGFESEVISF